MSSARERFSEIASREDERIDLAEAALCVAEEEYPELDPGRYRARLDELGERARRALTGTSGLRGQVERLNRLLFVEERFRGNRERYDDPRNSYLNEVLDRRTGIPITLSLVYLEVARRAGLRMRGIGFPGHFLVGCDLGAAIVVDAFHGSILDVEACQALLRAALGPEAVLEPETHLRAATPRQILARLLTNLKLLYTRSRDYARALACSERILLLVPEAPGELRDRGLLYAELECFAAAAADLERYLEQAVGDPAAPVLAQRLAALRERARQLH